MVGIDMEQCFFRFLGIALDVFLVVVLGVQLWRIIGIYRQGKDKRVLLLNLAIFLFCLCLGAYILYRNIA